MRKILPAVEALLSDCVGGKTIADGRHAGCGFEH
jgi:hypothetical protein